VSGPPNLKAWRRGQALRAEIRAILEAHPPLAPPLTAKEIRRHLKRNPLPSDRAIQWHVSRIRLQAELEQLQDALRSPQCTK
jgi:hypothetical protein